MKSPQIRPQVSPPSLANPQALQVVTHQLSSHGRLSSSCQGQHNRVQAPQPRAIPHGQQGSEDVRTARLILADLGGASVHTIVLSVKECSRKSGFSGSSGEPLLYANDIFGPRASGKMKGSGQSCADQGKMLETSSPSRTARRSRYGADNGARQQAALTPAWCPGPWSHSLSHRTGL